MKNKLLLLFLIITLTSCQKEQKTYLPYDTNSQVEIPTLTPELNTNLELLCRVWGFLKYHHPRVTEGYYNWDFELFEILPKYLLAQSNSQRDKILYNWIESLGKVDENTHETQNISNSKILPNHKWINNYSLNDSLKKQIKFIYKNRSEGDQYYIEMESFVGNPIFLNESNYKNISYLDDGFNLLALFRYWNAIEYFYPYKYLTDKSWDAVLTEYIAIFLDTKSELKYELAIQKLITEINDTHASIVKGGNKIREWYGNYQASVAVNFIENKLVVTSYYNSDLNCSGLQKGDIITHIEGETIEDIITKLTPYNSASNMPALKRRIASKVLRSNKRSLKIQVNTVSDSLLIDLPLYKEEDLKLENWVKKVMSNKFRILDKNIGYIPVVSVEEKDISSIIEDFENTKGIIIDLRYYPNTLDLIYQFIPNFISVKQQFVKFTNGNPDNPGEFYYKEPLHFSKNSDYYKGKVVLLVNEHTQSMGEFMAMAFQIGHNSTIIGSTTAGADGDVSYISLPGGIQTTITGTGVYYPDNRETQRIGIVPDVTIKPTINGIRNKQDELMDKAIDLILED